MNAIRFAPVAALFVLCGVVHAQTTISVNDVTQLRNALATVNGDSNGYVIEFTTGGTYTLAGSTLEDAAAQGDLDIFKAAGTVTIRPATGLNVTIDGGGVDRVFHVNNGINAPVTIEDITITGGNATDDGSSTGEGRGGAILKLGAGGLILNGVTISGNTATGQNGVDGVAGPPATAGSDGAAGSNALGGGLYASDGNVQVNNCTFSGNSAQGGDGGSGGPGGPEDMGSGGHGGDGDMGGFAHGGAIYYASSTAGASTLSVTGGLIQSNTATGGDGGAGGDGAAASAFAGNGGVPSFGGSARGGAIYIQTGTLIVTDVTLDQNAATGGNGGRGGNPGTGLNTADGITGQQGGNGGSGQGATVFGGGGTVSILSSTLSANTCTGGDGGDGGTGSDAGGIPGNGGEGGLGGNAHAGGVFVQNAGVTVINSTISGNVTNGGAGGDGGDGGSGSSTANGGAGGNGGQSRGTGAYVRSSTLGVDNSTVADNTANDGTGGAGGAAGSGGSAGSAGATNPGQAAGVFEDGTGGNLGAQSSIFADNTASIQPDADGTLTFNDCIVENGATPGGTGNLTGDPGLGTLQNNGGLTSTHAIGAGSIARDAGSNPQSLTNDQRGTGFPRDDGSGVDIGAYEFDPSATTPPPIVSDPGSTITVNAGSYSIQGTAQTGALVRIYTDLNNDGSTAGESVVGSMTVTGTTFSISVTLTQDTANDFLATAESTLAESNAVDVPTITEDSIAPAAPVVTDPASATATTGLSYAIQGTAEAGALIRVYIDFDNSGTVNGADVVVATQQLAAATTTFSVSTPITQSTTNNFVVTAVDSVGLESPEADVPTITETTPSAIAPPIVLSPSAPVSVDQANYTISGTAEADSLVRIYSDLNNDGFVNGGDTVVGSQQLTGGGTSFSISVALNQSAQNNFLATAEDSANNESLPADVPTITDTASTSGGGGGGGGGCSTEETPARGLPLWAALLAGGLLVIGVRRVASPSRR